MNDCTGWDSMRCDEHRSVEGLDSNSPQIVGISVGQTTDNQINDNSQSIGRIFYGSTDRTKRSQCLDHSISDCHAVVLFIGAHKSHQIEEKTQTEYNPKEGSRRVLHIKID